MGIFGIGTHGNVRIAQGQDYENFKTLAISANDPVTGKGGEIGRRAAQEGDVPDEPTGTRARRRTGGGGGRGRGDGREG